MGGGRSDFEVVVLSRVLLHQTPTPTLPTRGRENCCYCLLKRAKIHTLIALDKFRPARLASISPTSAAKDFLSSPAACFNASQNSGSNDSDVRWPAMVSERLSSVFGAIVALVAIEIFLVQFV